MKSPVLCACALLVAILALLALGGCKPPAETPTAGAPITKPAPPAANPAESAPAESAAPTEPVEIVESQMTESEYAKAIMAQYPDATEPPVDWSWSKDVAIDPATIPDAPAAGVMEGKLFEVKHAIIKKETDDETGVVTYTIRFMDTAPEDPTDLYAGDRYIEITTTNGGSGAVTDVPYDSEEWDINKYWMWYQTPQPDSPHGCSVNPNRSASLHLEFTSWDETASTENPKIIGSAKGKIGVGSQMFGGDTCWLAGNFDAVMIEY